MNRLDNSEKFANTPCNIQVLRYYFRLCPGQLRFKYDHTDTTSIDVDAIITTVAPEYNSTIDVYSLDESYIDAKNEYVSLRT